MSNEHTAYPLDWPPGWPRARSRTRSPFRVKIGEWQQGFLTIAQGRDRLLAELERLGAHYAVISTNVQVTLAGLPKGDAANPPDPGAAVYFALKGKPHVLACDKWDRVACNLAAIAKHIEALRGIDRWGVGSIERAFAGFAQLPPPGTAGAAETKRPWRELLEVPCPPNPDGPTREAFLLLAERRYKELARKAHPDAGGSTEAMAELTAAIDEARAELGGGA